MLAVAQPTTARGYDDIPILRRPVLQEVRSGAHCETCQMQKLCLPLGFEPEILGQFDRLIGKRIKFKKGETLYRPGEKFTQLFAIRLGSCKTVLLSEDGRDQVSGYHMAGDVIGSDGIGTEHHDCQAVALEDMEVCALPFKRVEELAHDNPRVMRNMNRMLAREISRERQVMLMLGLIWWMYAGYAFSIDFRDRRGHAYMLTDQEQTERGPNRQRQRDELQRRGRTAQQSHRHPSQAEGQSRRSRSALTVSSGRKRGSRKQVRPQGACASTMKASHIGADMNHLCPVTA